MFCVGIGFTTSNAWDRSLFLFTKFECLILIWHTEDEKEFKNCIKQRTDSNTTSLLWLIRTNITLAHYYGPSIYRGRIWYDIEQKYNSKKAKTSFRLRTHKIHPVPRPYTLAINIYRYLAISLSKCASLLWFGRECVQQSGKRHLQATETERNDFLCAWTLVH